MKSEPKSSSVFRLSGAIKRPENGRSSDKLSFTRFQLLRDADRARWARRANGIPQEPPPDAASSARSPLRNAKAPIACALQANAASPTCTHADSSPLRASNPASQTRSGQRTRTPKAPIVDSAATLLRESG